MLQGRMRLLAGALGLGGVSSCILHLDSVIRQRHCNLSGGLLCQVGLWALLYDWTASLAWAPCLSKAASRLCLQSGKARQKLCSAAGSYFELG